MLPPERQAGGRIDWIASYPKSGNTWMRLLLTNYLAEKAEAHDINEQGITRGIAASRRLFESALGISCDDLLPFESRALRPAAYRVLAEGYAGGLWLKAHDRLENADGEQPLFPAGISKSVIYIIRNPLDVAVSNAFHDGHGDMDRAVAKLCDKDMVIGHRREGQMPQHLGDWSDHVSSWVDQELIPVLVVRYEDMLADAGAQLSRVLRFARPECAVDPRKVDQAVAHSRIEVLQAAEADRRFRETPRKAERFFRRGTAGDWRNHLSPVQAARICHEHGLVMRRFGYETDIPPEDS